MAWNKKRLFTPFPIDRLQQTVHITRLLKSSIFFTIDETDSTNALAISSCLICGSIENVSHRFPSMIPYPSALPVPTFIGVYALLHDKISLPTSDGSCLRMYISMCIK